MVHQDQFQVQNILQVVVEVQVIKVVLMVEPVELVVAVPEEEDQQVIRVYQEQLIPVVVAVEEVCLLQHLVVEQVALV
tara:strand:+ start:383 stop:616 length:234 start_codon:yes stop_codon:yes gene_type:complete